VNVGLFRFPLFQNVFLHRRPLSEHRMGGDQSSAELRHL
jgi:hypothetical protein